MKLRGFSFARLGALLMKEMIQMRRDRLTFGMMMGIPLIQLLLFGYAINTDPRALPTAMVSSVSDRFTRAITSAIETTGYYEIVASGVTADEANHLMLSGDVAFVITIPGDIGARAMRGENPRILVEADASDPSASSGAISALSTVAQHALRRELGTEAQAETEAETSLDIVVHRRFNPEGITQYNIVPGLLGVILQMTMMMMTAMALTREVERGTMENLLAMPATAFEIMLGKILPYVGVGAVQVFIVLVAAQSLFGVPFIGSFTLLLWTILLFIVTLVLMGYTISTFARNQMQAMQLTFFLFLPSILLSGFMFPFRGMPDWAQAIGEVLPLTHFLRIIRGIMLKGSEAVDIRAEIFALVAIGAVMMLAALLRFRRTLD
jgi:ABC-2 type transport system permease protein